MTDWTPEEEAVATDLRFDPPGQNMGIIRSLCVIPSISRPVRELLVKLANEVDDLRAMHPRWRDVRTDPPPRYGTDVLLWREGRFHALPPIVAGWFEKGTIPGWYTYDEPDKAFNGEVTHWQPITPPLPTAPEDRT